MSHDYKNVDELFEAIPDERDDLIVMEKSSSYGFNLGNDAFSIGPWPNRLP